MQGFPQGYYYPYGMESLPKGHENVHPYYGLEKASEELAYWQKFSANNPWDINATDKLETAQIEYQKWQYYCTHFPRGNRFPPEDKEVAQARESISSAQKYIIFLFDQIDYKIKEVTNMIQSSNPQGVNSLLQSLNKYCDLNEQKIAEFIELLKDFKRFPESSQHSSSNRSLEDMENDHKEMEIRIQAQRYQIVSVCAHV